MTDSVPSGTETYSKLYLPSTDGLLRLGDEVPNFEANTTHGRIDFHEWLDGKWAILFSHPDDFTPLQAKGSEGDRAELQRPAVAHNVAERRCGALRQQDRDRLSDDCGPHEGNCGQVWNAGSDEQGQVCAAAHGALCVHHWAGPQAQALADVSGVSGQEHGRNRAVRGRAYSVMAEVYCHACQLAAQPQGAWHGGVGVLAAHGDGARCEQVLSGTQGARHALWKVVHALDAELKKSRRLWLCQVGTRAHARTFVCVRVCVVGGRSSNRSENDALQALRVGRGGGMRSSQQRMESGLEECTVGVSPDGFTLSLPRPVTTRNLRVIRGVTLNIGGEKRAIFCDLDMSSAAAAARRRGAHQRARARVRGARARAVLHVRARAEPRAAGRAAARHRGGARRAARGGAAADGGAARRARGGGGARAAVAHRGGGRRAGGGRERVERAQRARALLLGQDAADARVAPRRGRQPVVVHAVRAAAGHAGQGLDRPLRPVHARADDGRALRPHVPLQPHARRAAVGAQRGGRARRV
ncbi:peroxiredoxin PRX1 [Gracilaria domingensis]|nr:peroxiredoxin PRX1 [Gracilaria domingensis]